MPDVPKHCVLFPWKAHCWALGAVHAVPNEGLLPLLGWHLQGKEIQPLPFQAGKPSSGLLLHTFPWHKFFICDFHELIWTEVEIQVKIHINGILRFFVVQIQAMCAGCMRQNQC